MAYLTPKRRAPRPFCMGVPPPLPPTKKQLEGSLSPRSLGRTIGPISFQKHRQTGNPTRLHKWYNLFQYIIIRSKEKTELHFENSIRRHINTRVKLFTSFLLPKFDEQFGNSRHGTEEENSQQKQPLMYYYSWVSRDVTSFA